jgi:hypothetical protein
MQRGMRSSAGGSGPHKTAVAACRKSRSGYFAHSSARPWLTMRVELPTVNNSVNVKCHALITIAGLGLTFLGLTAGVIGWLLISAGVISLLHGDWSAAVTIACGILALVAGWVVIRGTFTLRKSAPSDPRGQSHG